MNNPLIIENPELQSLFHRYGWRSITFAFWVLYIYLWLPLITLAAWWLGVKLFNLHIIKLNGYAGLASQLGLYCTVILTMSFVLIGWAEIERLRFKGSFRRADNLTVTVAEVAKKYQLQEVQLSQLMQKKFMRVHFSAKGEISKIVEYE